MSPRCSAPTTWSASAGLGTPRTRRLSSYSASRSRSPPVRTSATARVRPSARASPGTTWTSVRRTTLGTATLTPTRSGRLLRSPRSTAAAETTCPPAPKARPALCRPAAPDRRRRPGRRRRRPSASRTSTARGRTACVKLRPAPASAMLGGLVQSARRWSSLRP